MQKSKFDIIGMSCSACSSRIQQSVNKLEGVKKAEVNLLSNYMHVEYDENLINENEIIKCVKSLGYDAINHTNSISAKNKSISNKALIKLIVSISILIPLMFFSMSNMFGIVIDSKVLLIIECILTLAIIIINKKYFASGYKAIFKLNPNMDSLIALSCTVSVLYSIYLICFTDNYINNLYFDSAAMILTFVSIGKYFESLSKSKTTDAISKLIDLSPDYTLLLVDGKEKLVKTDDVKIGDKVILKAGYRISIDGVVIEGEGYADESALTGESKQVKKGFDSNVYCGTTFTSGYVIVEAIYVKEDTKLSKIVNLVEEASSSKAPISRLADKISLFFVPSIILISLLTLVIWTSLIGEVNLGINFAICVLVISCPCALGLATPTAIMVGTGKAAQNGILIKSSESLELLAKTENIVFDKTGTLTIGKPSVTTIKTFDFDKNKLIKIAASIESHSQHPLAHAICDYYSKDDLFIVSNFKSITGKGISGIIDNTEYFIGNKEYIEANNIYISIIETKSESTTSVYISNKNTLLGIIYISDQIKENTKETIELINNMGIETYLLSGDAQDITSNIQKQTSINHSLAKLLPEDKAQYINFLKGIGTTIMVGDGINDSPALVSADVGIAIGAGTDIAIDSADVILIKNDLSDIVTAIDLSKKVVKNIKENLFWAFIYNVICIPIAAGVLYYPLGIKLSPIIGTIAMSLSSICVVLNALRIRKFSPRKTKEKNIMTTIYVEGMMCEHCKAHVEQALKNIGITGLVNLKDGTVTINESITVDDTQISNAITQAGYKVTNISHH